MMLLIPSDCKASISNLSARAPNCLRIPIPLVPPVIALLAKVPAAAPNVIPAEVVAAFPPPVIPEIVS